MQQRVAFIRTLASAKEILCLDEAFGALDALTRTEMQRWRYDILMIENRTILFITHSVEEALLLSDRIYVLSPRPLTVKKEIQVPFDRADRFNRRNDNTFLSLRYEIEQLLVQR
jgi:ABC-type nitrate/sulfonate/bicarbonate transport system ATPase subunit